MSKRLGHTNIEYGDLAWNFYPGCLHKPAGICPVPHCWAEGMSKRQLQDFHQPQLVPELLLSPLSVKKPSTILVNFMGDIMGSWVNPSQGIEIFPMGGAPRGFFECYTLQGIVMEVIEKSPQHRFLFLTKAPWNYRNWGDFPKNAWLGATVTNEESLVAALYSLTEVKAGGRWLSVEPMYGQVVPKVWPAEWDEIGWVVIGGQSNPVKYPDVYWVEDLVMECIKTKIPVWLKNNLAKALPAATPFYALNGEKRETQFRTEIKLVYRQECPKDSEG